MSASRVLIAGNWKMNPGTYGEAQALLAGLGGAELPEGVGLAVFPPQAFLAGLTPPAGVALGAQNMHAAEGGAFTGEVSAAMLVSLGVTHVLCGHSERRQLFGEGDRGVAEKAYVALEAGLYAVLCVGETLEEREAGATERVVSAQLSELLGRITGEAISRLIVAYEPVWAIGTGKTATPAQVQEIHAVLRHQIARLFPEEAPSVPILYGGSVNPGNAATFLALQDVNGVLVGGASLKAESFLAIAKAAPAGSVAAE